MKARRTLISGLAAAAAVAVTSLGSASAAASHTSNSPATPAIAEQFVHAWNSPDLSALARLFTNNATYTDRGVDGQVHGRAGVVEWKTRTEKLIADLHVTIVDAFRSGDHAEIETIYAGHIRGAPKPFAVHAVSVMRLRGNRIVTNTDYYNLSDLLKQSGLPPTFTAPK